MILEEQVVKIIKEDMNKIKNNVPWDGMYDDTAHKIVNKIKEELVK